MKEADRETRGGGGDALDPLFAVEMIGVERSPGG